MDTVRIGILGAARIAPAAVIKPARNVERSRRSARSRPATGAAPTPSRRSTASRRCTTRTTALIADPDIDAIYNPLPNGLHAEWTIAALEAGKHVLCEKPFTANAKEAEDVAAVAARTGLVVMEAFHYRYHPLAQRMREIVESGELGTHPAGRDRAVLPAAEVLRHPLPVRPRRRRDDGRRHATPCTWRACSAARSPRSCRPTPKLRTPDVDRAMRAELTFPSGHTGRITCSMWSTWVIQTSARVDRRPGRAARDQPDHAAAVAPHAREGRRQPRAPSSSPRRPTYEYQLEAFCAAVLRGEPTLTPPADSIANMRVLDAIYVAAGMTPRGT